MIRRHKCPEPTPFTAVTVRTPPEAWSYGATLDLPSSAATNARAVVVDGWITRGAVGVGICSADGSTMLDERRLPAGDGSRAFRVELLPPDTVGTQLVVRTADLPLPGEVIITGLSAALPPTAAEAWAELPIAPRAGVADWHLHFGMYAETIAGRVRLTTLDPSADTIEIPWFGGTVALDPRAEITRAIAGSGIYEPGLLWALTHLVRPGDGIVMAGAHAGVMPAFLAHLTGPDGAVIAVEPSPREFAMLERNIPRLASGVAITPVNAALSNAPGQATFRVAPPGASGHGQLGDGVDGIIVDVTTVDALAEATGRSIEVIVLDLEGHEVDALDGAHRVIERDRPVIITEVDGAGATDRVSVRLAPRLRALGYALLSIETGSGATAAFPGMPTGASWALVALPPRLQSPVTLDALMHRHRLGDNGAPTWVSDGAVVQRQADGITVAGPDIAWEYLAEWGIPDQPEAAAAHDVIEVRAMAHGGPAQLVVVERSDGRITEVAVLPRHAGPVRIPLAQSASAAGRSLVLRTGASGGARVELDAPIVTRSAQLLNPALRITTHDRGDVDEVQPQPGARTGNLTDALADGINAARLKWLESLHLDITGRRVVDFDAGIGVFAPFFIARGGRYLGMEGREANIRAARDRLPEAEFVEADLRRLAPGEIPDDIEIGLVFGLLCHLDDPRTLLDALGASRARLLVVETLVCDDDLPVLLARRGPMTENQALDGRGSRPSVQWLIDATRDAGFPYIASSGLPVEHSDFTFASLHDGSWRRDGHNLRVAFVAGRDDADIPAHLVRA